MQELKTRKYAGRIAKNAQSGEKRKQIERTKTEETNTPKRRVKRTACLHLGSYLLVRCCVCQQVPDSHSASASKYLMPLVASFFGKHCTVHHGSHCDPTCGEASRFSRVFFQDIAYCAQLPSALRTIEIQTRET